MYLHATVYRIFEHVTVLLRTEVTSEEAREGWTPSSRSFTGALPDELVGQPELMVMLDALRSAVRSAVVDLEGRGDYSGPLTFH